MKSDKTTLCYLERCNAQGVREYLMLHRIKKDHDINKDKWIGIGGHFEDMESPDECMLREAKEETGLQLTELKLRGIVTFICGETCEYMHLFTSNKWQGEMTDCNEGVLEWLPRDRVYDLNLWEGDKIFFRLLEMDYPCFLLKLRYSVDGVLESATLDGKIVMWDEKTRKIIWQ